MFWSYFSFFILFCRVTVTCGINMIRWSCVDLQALTEAEGLKEDAFGSQIAAHLSCQPVKPSRTKLAWTTCGPPRWKLKVVMPAANPTVVPRVRAAPNIYTHKACRPPPKWTGSSPPRQHRELPPDHRRDAWRIFLRSIGHLAQD